MLLRSGILRLIALLIGVTVLVSRKYLQEDVAVESPEEEKEAEKKEAPALLSFIRKPEMLLIQLGIVGLFAWWWKARCLIGVDFTSNRYCRFLSPYRLVSWCSW